MTRFDGSKDRDLRVLERVLYFPRAHTSQKVSRRRPYCPTSVVKQRLGGSGALLRGSNRSALARARLRPNPRIAIWRCMVQAGANPTDIPPVWQQFPAKLLILASRRSARPVRFHSEFLIYDTVPDRSGTSPGEPIPEVLRLNIVCPSKPSASASNSRPSICYTKKSDIWHCRWQLHLSILAASEPIEGRQPPVPPLLLTKL